MQTHCTCEVEHHHYVDYILIKNRDWVVCVCVRADNSQTVCINAVTSEINHGWWSTCTKLYFIFCHICQVQTYTSLLQQQDSIIIRLEVQYYILYTKVCHSMKDSAGTKNDTTCASKVSNRILYTFVLIC